MNPVAIEHAKERLEVASEAYAKLQQATVANSHKEIRREWTNFLQAASAVYSKLEQGSKTNGKSTAWFGRKKKERRDDALLSYIHHARDADYHGLAAVMREGDTATVTFPVGIGPHKEMSIKVRAEDGAVLNKNQFNMIDPRSGRNVKPTNLVMQKYLKVVTVRDDRYGDSFDPPTLHLGKPFHADTPLKIAQAALKYLNELVVEAENYVVP